jgi:DNA replication and repair protein RecF
LLRIKDISLLQFKNYSRAAFSFNERIVGICGNNGVGKTNLLDALYYLCFTKSYFSRSDQQSVFRGASGFRLEGRLEAAGKETEVVCILRETGRKEFLTNGEAYEKLSRHIGRFPCVIIAPDDIQIITGASDERRRFLDALISQLDPVYLQNLIDYNKILQQRNGFLKSLPDRRLTDRGLLEVYDSQLVATGSAVFAQRRKFLSGFLPLAGRYYTLIAGSEEPVALGYESQLMFGSFGDLLANSLEKDLYLQRTGVGIHRDDIGLTFADLPFKTMASQGQRKSLLFALKLAEYETLRRDKGFSPLLLLDDVFEKLDAFRMRNLLDRVCMQGDGQIFITDTHPERIRGELDGMGVSYQIIGL